MRTLSLTSLNEDDVLAVVQSAESDIRLIQLDLLIHTRDDKDMKDMKD